LESEGQPHHGVALDLGALLTVFTGGVVGCREMIPGAVGLMLLLKSLTKVTFFGCFDNFSEGIKSGNLQRIEGTG
jgi:hypothetical protein